MNVSCLVSALKVLTIMCRNSSSVDVKRLWKKARHSGVRILKRASAFHGNSKGRIRLVFGFIASFLVRFAFRSGKFSQDCVPLLGISGSAPSHFSGLWNKYKKADAMMILSGRLANVFSVGINGF